MKKAIRVKISAGAGVKGLAKFLVDEKAYEIYKKACPGRVVLIESLLLDSYKNEKYQVLFHSKRFNDNQVVLSSPFDIYVDAEKNKHVLLESLLLEAEKDERYNVFFNSFNEQHSDTEEIKELEVFDPADEDEEDTEGEELIFTMLEEESEKDDEW